MFDWAFDRYCGRPGKATRLLSAPGSASEPGISCQCDSFCPALGAELAQDCRHVVADGLLADGELLGNFAIAEPLRHKFQNISLARRQFVNL